MFSILLRFAIFVLAHRLGYGDGGQPLYVRRGGGSKPLTSPNANMIVANAERPPFLWGVATAAYQIEGAANSRGENIWDAFSRIPGKISNGDNGDVADDSVHKLREDLAMLDALGVNSYRFSISWARVMPLGVGEINQEGVAYYDSLINGLIKRGIEPVVTLYHWDLPNTLQEQYNGWLSREVVDAFVKYADFCFETFGNRVKRWVTFNEPWTFLFLGYGAGTFAPGRCSDRSRCPQGNSSVEVYYAGHNVLIAHAAAVALYRERHKDQGGEIGIVLNLDWGEPLTNSEADISAANRHNEFGLAWFADPIFYGRYPQSMIDAAGDRLPVISDSLSRSLKGSSDFLGLNHYSSKYYRAAPEGISGKGWTEDQRSVESKFDVDGRLIGAQAASPWLNVVPWGFFNTLVWVSQRYKSDDGHLPALIITENGCDVPDESSLSAEDVLRDDFRVEYRSSYISEMKRAMLLGLVNIKGYMVWSLMDNFEWADGYAYRFGLYFVDHKDPQRLRLAKRSAVWYGAFIKDEGSLPPFNNGRTEIAIGNISSRIGGADSTPLTGINPRSIAQGLVGKIRFLVSGAAALYRWPQMP